MVFQSLTAYNELRIYANWYRSIVNPSLDTIILIARRWLSAEAATTAGGITNYINELIELIVTHDVIDMIQQEHEQV